jgi:hypothetical protein
VLFPRVVFLQALALGKLTLFRGVCVVLVAMLLLCCLVLNNIPTCPTIRYSTTAATTASHGAQHQEKVRANNGNSDNLISDNRKVDTNVSENSPPTKPSQTKLNLPDEVDFVPDVNLDGVFPKPAPPLFLSVDNNGLVPEEQLLEGLVKPNVHIVWCGRRWFEFRMYLSVVSIIRAVQPDKVLFHYEHYPPIDKNMYNLWLDDLKHDYQFFEAHEMGGGMGDVLCHSDHDTKLAGIGELLGDVGGIYITEGTWILDFPAAWRQGDILMALDEHFEGFLMVRGGIVSKQKPLPQVLKQPGDYNVSQHSCSSVHHVYQGVTADCIVVRGGKFETIYPMDYVYVDNDPFAAILRKLFYGSEKIHKPEPDHSSLVPNIGHMIWIGGGEMDFVFFLSLLSMLYVVKVDVLYIHGDQPPTGEYWARVCALPAVRGRVKLVTRDPPSLVYQGAIEPWYRALMSDIIRVDLMIKYGGVYTDTDAIWARGLSLEERAYDAVATYDWVDWSYPYPDTVNFGVSYGKRNAPFYRLFRDSMRRLDNDLHGFTGVAMPYKILEKHPGLLRIDRRLGVICYYSRCHPLWEKDYHNMTHDHVVANSIRNWRNDVHAFHWTHPNPVELHNQTILLNSKGIFAELGQFVLQQAGLL